MTPLDGIDYAFSPHPSAAAMKAAGIKFVMRYCSPNPANDANGKNLMPAELRALMDAGLAVGLVFESSGGRMLGGHDAGVADATYADHVVKALGMPGLPVYFACDFDATEADQIPIGAYLDGAASVITRPRTGIYGGYYPVSRALDAGKAAWAWQTYAWSGGQWDPRAQLRQVRNGVSVGGAPADEDEAHAADFGQWPRPKLPPGPQPFPSGRHQADGTGTLAALAKRQGCDVTDIWDATFAGLDLAAQEPGDLERRYLNRGDWHAKMPAGMVLWLP